MSIISPSFKFSPIGRLPSPPVPSKSSVSVATVVAPKVLPSIPPVPSNSMVQPLINIVKTPIVSPVSTPPALNNFIAAPIIAAPKVSEIESARSAVSGRGGDIFDSVNDVYESAKDVVAGYGKGYSEDGGSALVFDAHVDTFPVNTSNITVIALVCLLGYFFLSKKKLF